jgi:NADPH:quinone reductase-like Zn-dependent oxidoreductase
VKRIVIRKPGTWSSLELEKCADPGAPGPHDVVVNTQYSGVNFADVVARQGLYESANKQVGYPMCLGFEWSGRVAALGAEVKDLAVGQYVFGVSRFGAYASRLRLDRRFVFPIPERFSPAQAAAFPVAFLTAYYGLFELGAAKAGQAVLVHSAAGGVGGALAQLARARGCRVFGVVGSAHKREAALRFGCDEVAVKPEGSRGWVDAARRFSPEGFHVVLDANGAETLRASYGLLGTPGRLVIYGFHTMFRRGGGRTDWLRLAWQWLRTPRFDPLRMTNDNKAVFGFNLSYLFDESELLGRAMREFVSGIERGELTAPPVEEVPAAEVGRAHARLESGDTVGKIVLRW